jgi:hypothetical protein
MAGPDEMGGANGAGGTPDASGGMDLDALLGGTSPDMGETTPDLQGGFPGQGAGSSGQDAAYKFAGRTWKGGQREAETAWNKMYGKFSESQGLLNQLKQIAKDDPELAQELSQDPRLAGIFAKLGVESAEQSIRGNSQRQQGNGMSPEDYHQELVIERQQNRILREEWGFERKLGRQLSEREQQAVYKQLERSENLSYEEAYFLAHREQIMKRQAQANAAQGQGLPQNAGGRPKPPPRSMPGTPAPGRKSVSDMSESEWKDNLRQSGVIKELMSRGMSRE